MNFLPMMRMMSVALLCTSVISFSSCKSTDIASRYTSKYINSNTNKITTQVPETYELGYIVLALTDYGQRDTNIINTHTLYYKEVVEYFSAYKNHHAVKLLNQELSKDSKHFRSFRDGLYAFKINNHDHFVLKSDYRIDLNKVNFKRFAPLLQDFAAKSNFLKFYNDHLSLYSKLVDYQTHQLTMENANKAVQSEYGTPFNSYHVIISPLMKGYSTLAVNGRHFNECLIFTEAKNYTLLYGESHLHNTVKEQEVSQLAFQQKSK